VQEVVVAVDLDPGVEEVLAEARREDEEERRVGEADLRIWSGGFR
jgi:hypothetical protein